MIVRRLIVVPLLTMTDVSTICVEVIFRVIFRIYQKQRVPLPSNCSPEACSGSKIPRVYDGFYTSNIGLQRLSAGSNRLNRKVSWLIFSSPGIPSGSQFKKDDPRLKIFSTQLETNLCQCVHFRPLKLNIYRSL